MDLSSRNSNLGSLFFYSICNQRIIRLKTEVKMALKTDSGLVEGKDEKPEEAPADTEAESEKPKEASE